MTLSFHHGLETLEISDGIRPIQVVRSAVIGIIGTAPEADANLFPLNTPVLIAGNPYDVAEAKLGATGTLPQALAHIFACVRAYVIIVRVEEGASANETLMNVLGSSLQETGIYAFLKAKMLTGYNPRILIAPGFTSTRPSGLKTIAVTNGGSGYASAPEVTLSGGGGGQGATAHAVLSSGAVSAVVIDTAGVGYTAAPNVTFSGGGGTGAAATATIGAYASPVVTALAGLAPRLRAMVVPDGPNTTAADAYQFSQDFGSARCYPVDPYVMVQGVGGPTPVPASPLVAGMMAYSDKTRGYWWSPSNQVLPLVIGTNRNISFMLNDPDTEAGYLNKHGIATIIREDGFRLWGNRTLSDDPNWRFVNVRRTADIIYESMEASFLWAMDRPFSVNHVLEIEESVNAFLRTQKAAGAILGGKAWVDPEVNTKDVLLAGQFYLDFDIEPPAPMEHVVFRAHRNSGYYEELIADVIRASA